METFIYKDLKKASLNKDCSRVKTLGPYAKVMAEIIYGAYWRKLIKDKELAKNYTNQPVYRGMLIDETKIEVNIENNKCAWKAIFEIGTKGFDLNEPLRK